MRTTATLRAIDAVFTIDTNDFAVMGNAKNDKTE